MKTTTIKLLLVGFLGTILWSGCLKSDDSNNDFPVFGLKMVNAYHAAPAVVYVLDNNYIQYPAQPLLYKEHAYIEHYAGQRRLRVAQATTEGNTIVDTTFTFKDSTLYTSFVYGDQAHVMHLITEDRPLSNIGDESAVRFLHLASNTGAVDVFIGDASTPVFVDRMLDEDVEENDHEVFVAHSGGKQMIRIKDDEGNTLVEREYDFAAGGHYSIILIGDEDSSETPLYLGVVPH